MREKIIIEASRPVRYYWLDLWQYRELFRVLAWRDLSVRYKQTVIGVLWAVVRPMMSIVVFTVIFGHIAHLPSEGNAPYPLMVFAGVLPWTFFSGGLSEASTSLLTNSSLISKVYFPRMIVPIATIGVALVDFGISFCMLLVLMLLYRYPPDWRLVALPILVFWTFCASAGPALWIASLNIKYRDFRYVVPFLIQLGVYISPVGFSSAVVPERWRFLYSLNPVVGLIDSFRWCLLRGQVQVYLPSLIESLLVTMFLLWFGVRRFRKAESIFADLI